jgi:DNA-binding CsgD family transcriptional regulator/ligand-binding sensor domain-containing protein
MSLKQIFFTTYFVLFLNSFFIVAQELPPIVKYSTSSYSAGNQNWMISQDKNQFIYFANNSGLLEFNGSSWTLYNSPNETIIRSVTVVKDRIYTGSYMEFGFWKRNSQNQLVYKSLSQQIKNKILDDEQFWNILQYDTWVIFQSLNRIYIYNTATNTFSILKPKSEISRSFQTSTGIYFQTFNEGLFELENGKSNLICSTDNLLNNKIINLFSTSEGIEIVTQNNGIFKLENSKIIRSNNSSNYDLTGSSIYSCQKLRNGMLVFGTVSNGIFILAQDRTIKYHITQGKGLSNNTALSLFEDVDSNLWIGLDNGINCININSPVKSYVDESGLLGTVYCSIIFNDNLYIGTNQGLFYKKNQSDESFKIIENTKGQVWSLFTQDGTLFCGHDLGTLTIYNNQAQFIFRKSGTWKFSKVPNHPNLIAQGNYYGISILEKTGDQWQFKNKIKGFDYSSKYFEIGNNNTFYVSHEYKGVFRLQVDSDFQKSTNLITYKTPGKGKNSSLTKFNNTIYYTYKEGIFKLNQTTNTFELNKNLSEIFKKDDYTSGKLISDSSGKMWLFTKNYIHYYSQSKLSNQLKLNSIPIPNSLTNTMSGYENVSQISNSNYLVGTTDGYYIIDINDLLFKNYTVSISSITFNKQNDKINFQAINQEGRFAHDENNITINYTVPEYNKYINSEFQYKLEGVQNEWSSWSSKSSSNFKNLSPGTYTFKVRAKTANTTPEYTASYTFTITKPWYLTNLAVLIYLILAIIGGMYVHNLYKKYYQKQEQKLIEENNLLLEIKELETEQELMKLRNEKLSQDVDAKSKELAVSTMSLLKKNELLAVIKEDLKKTSEETNTNRTIKTVISTINKNITNEDTWNVFKEAFDTADKDFLKKMKQLHSSLTPNDLRLCAYLRLNLSSKEIAPLLNISVRSVEIKRYRLRKKMNLAHEDGLVEYVLSV